MEEAALPGDVERWWKVGILFISLRYNSLNVGRRGDITGVQIELESSVRVNRRLDMRKPPYRKLGPH